MAAWGPPAGTQLYGAAVRKSKTLISQWLCRMMIAAVFPGAVAMSKNIRLNVNGKTVEAAVEPRLLLVHFLREVLGLTGAHVGCESTVCGACTVLLEGRAVKSCTVFAVQADGRKVETVEGLAANGDLHPMQQAFWDEHALQCGY